MSRLKAKQSFGSEAATVESSISAEAMATTKRKSRRPSPVSDKLIPEKQVYRVHEVRVLLEIV
jgi:hypothetical protein